MAAGQVPKFHSCGKILLNGGIVERQAGQTIHRHFFPVRLVRELNVPPYDASESGKHWGEWVSMNHHCIDLMA